MKKPILATLAMALALAAANLAIAEERTQVYAPPNFFGKWTVVRSHIGPATFKIKVEPIGDTVVTGEVQYFDKNGKKVERGFFRETEITTGDSIANVQVRLKGTPTGSSCFVTVKP